MSTYLIDYENVSMNAVMEMSFKEGDVVYFFYTDHCEKFNIEFIGRATKEKFNVFGIKGKSGAKDALDMLICSNLGFMICKNPTEEYILVTNDNGFDTTRKYWKDEGYKVSCKKTKDEKASSKKASTKTTKKEEDKKEIEITEDEIEKIKEEMIQKIQEKVVAKRGVHNHLVNIYGQEKGSKIYKEIKKDVI